ncbi:AraC family transcriptional regulator [Pseudomonas sp. Marseille-P9899]|uniref:AraC family transcriptional regulator n=1 Tax=Pseudomonas sp. Marseille-P9899 TaxID=2730401 RepID=UPI00158EBAE3|nr:AraC family transcriptional regulator [Pseudomonas sp. Marseille-P9899]
MHTLSRTFAGAILAALGDSDPAVAALCRRLGEPLLAASGPAFISLASLTALFEQASALSGDPDIGLRAFHHAHPANLGPLGYALMSSPTIGSVLTAMAEFHHLIGTGFCLFVEERIEGVRLVGVVTDPEQQPLSRVFIDAIAAITLGLLCWLVPGRAIRPLRAELSYPRPADTRAAEALYGAEIHYGAAQNALLFSHADVQFAVATHDPALHAVHSQYLAQWQRQLDSDAFSLRARRVISEHFALGRPVTLAGVAESLGLSQHQLSRGLENEGHGFLRLLDEVRLRDSHNLLRSSTLSFKQIAYQVGFRHQSAFNKACERWFGMGPGRYRDEGNR